MSVSAWKPDGTNSAANSSRESKSSALRGMVTSIVGRVAKSPILAEFRSADRQAQTTTKKGRGKFRAPLFRKCWTASAALGVDRIRAWARGGEHEEAAGNAEVLHEI